MASQWPESTQKAFESYTKSGGSFVSVHAACNSFSEWKTYNQMIGLGDWGDRNENNAPYIYYTKEGKLVEILQQPEPVPIERNIIFPLPLAITSILLPKECQTFG